MTVCHFSLFREIRRFTIPKYILRQNRRVAAVFSPHAATSAIVTPAETAYCRDHFQHVGSFFSQILPITGGAKFLRTPKTA